MTQHLFAVTLVVPDYEEGISYFCDLLGFDLLEDERLSETKRWVMVAPKGGGTALLLAKAAGPEQSAVIGHQTGGRVGFFLHTQDFDADYQRMASAGVTFCEEPRSESYGKVVVFEDPWGNRWDLLQRIQPS